MLGQKSKYADECYKESFIGADFGIEVDLSNKLFDNWKTFNHEFVPIYLASNPDKTRISAGLACGALWTVAKGILQGDIVLCPNGLGSYYVGEVLGDYYYNPNEILPHRRLVKWYHALIERASMSQALQYSAGSIGTVSTISKYGEEIEKLMSSNAAPTIVSTDSAVEDPSVFALEEHLEHFLIKNWGQTDLGKRYDIYTEDGEVVGQQYKVDTGAIDILAISKDKKELLVVELKRGRASDVVVGQILRYMGYALEELAEKGQAVKGVIIAFEDDKRIRRALVATNNIEFYRYQVSFNLIKN